MAPTVFISSTSEDLKKYRAQAAAAARTAGSDLTKIERSGQHLLSIINECWIRLRSKSDRVQMDMEDVGMSAILEDVCNTSGECAKPVTNACKFTERGEVNVLVAQVSDAGQMMGGKITHSEHAGRRFVLYASCAGTGPVDSEMGTSDLLSLQAQL